MRCEGLCCTFPFVILLVGRLSLGAPSTGMNSSCKMFPLQVCRGGSGSLILPLDLTRQKIIEKYDPETKKWKEVAMTHRGGPNHLETRSLSLADQVFTVWNVEKTDLYRIKQEIDDECLAIVNVTVLDCPLPITPSSSNVSSMVISSVTETADASPPGSNYTAIRIAVSVSVCIIFVVAAIVAVVKKCICRPNKPRSVEQCRNGYLPYQQCKTSAV